MPVKRREERKLTRSLAFIACILLIDQLSKHLVMLNMKVGESVSLINNIIHLTFLGNTGAAFGLFKGGGIFFIWISVISIIVIGMVLFRSSKNAGLLFVLGGALGNLIDRVRFGYVIDFIDVKIWPVFNFADASITIGAILLVWTLTK